MTTRNPPSNRCSRTRGYSMAASHPRRWRGALLAVSMVVTSLMASSCSAKGEPAVKMVSGGPPSGFVNSVGMEMVLIPAGSFMMGSPEGEEGRYSHEGPQQIVAISKPFCMSACEVTQEQYERVMGVNHSYFKGTKKPVDSVSWLDAANFCERLSDQEGIVYRLPTEAEWEYACRAGSTGAYCFGNSERQLSDYAWYNTLLGELIAYAEPLWGSYPVAAKKPNTWGLYDMHGNVMEWCQDRYGEYTTGPHVDPTGAANPLKHDPGRVLRNGSWATGARDCRCASRCSYRSSKRNMAVGFRVICTSIPPLVKKEAVGTLPDGAGTAGR